MKLNEFLRIPLRLPRNFEEKSTTTRRSAHHKTKRCCKHSRRPVYARWRLPSSGSWPLTSARKSSRRTHLDLLAAAQTSAMKYLARLTLIFRPKRPGSARCTRAPKREYSRHHIPSGTRKSASIARLLFARVSSVSFVVLREKKRSIMAVSFFWKFIFFLCSILLRN